MQNRRQAVSHTSDGPPAALPLPSAVDAPGNWAACRSRTFQEGGEGWEHMPRAIANMYQTSPIPSTTCLCANSKEDG